jgi:acyl-CoA thioesterase-1
LCGMNALPRYGWDYTLAFHRIFPALASKHDVPFVPFLLSGVALVPEMNGSDGVHPNAAGARRIAENVWPYLEPMLRVDLSSEKDAHSVQRSVEG